MKPRLRITAPLGRFFAAGLFLVANLAHAHDPGLSTATVRLVSGSMEVSLAIAVRDAEQISRLDADGNGSITHEEFSAGKQALEAVVMDEFIISLDGEIAKPATMLSWLDSNNDVCVAFSTPARTCTNLAFQSKLLSRLPNGHREFFVLETGEGRKLAERLFSEKDNSVTVDMIASPDAKTETHNTATTSFTGFLALGVEHILTGYDHLLFLFALLVVTSRFGPALKIITCFTIAHSITLAVATFGTVQISSRFIEPLIAASIVYVGIENLFRGDDPKGRWLLTFAFGLIHGFGFASVLRELGVGSNGGSIAVPLVSFNLGVELGQIMVAAIALPVIWKLRTHPVFIRRWVPVCSVLVTILGGYWFIQRVWPN